MAKKRKVKWENTGPEAHSLKLLEKNVAGNLNGYICYDCERLFVASSRRAAKIDHDLWLEDDKSGE